VKPRERIEAAVRAAAASGEPALVAFLTAGYPGMERFRADLAAVAAGADVVEIGVPFTDPMADGVTIQRSSQSALRQGVSLRWILAELNAMQRPAAPLVLMSYLNPLLQYGYERLAADAAAAGVCGFIVPDLPFDEGDELRAALDQAGVALVQMVTPVTTSERLARVCGASQGFVYAVTMTGTTGKSVVGPDTVLDYLEAVRRVSPVPRALDEPASRRTLRAHVSRTAAAALCHHAHRGARAGGTRRSPAPGAAGGLGKAGARGPSVAGV
jgi:tryptophan synthase alpha chain